MLQPAMLECQSETTGSDSKRDRKLKDLRQTMRATRVVCFPSVDCILIAFEIEWFTKYLSDEFEVIYDFHISEIE